MRTREAVRSRTQKALSSHAIRVGRVWVARGAITLVLAVTGSALLLVALTVLDAAPLAAFAAVVWASWRASARLAAELDRGEPARREWEPRVVWRRPDATPRQTV